VQDKDMKEIIPHWIRTLVLFSKHNENDDVKEDNMARACSTYGEEDEWV
jgi:hypothetical protein